MLTQGGCEFETEVAGAPENSQPNRPQTKNQKSQVFLLICDHAISTPNFKEYKSAASCNQT